MKLTIFFTLLISVCWAQQQETISRREARAPQGHNIQYNDPAGSKVNYRLYAPYIQWKSHLGTPQRNDRANYGESVQSSPEPRTELFKPEPVSEQRLTRPEQSTQQVPQVQQVQHVQQIQPVQVQYKPYSMVPMHIKQLMLQMYQPHEPYVDPSVYIYQIQQQQQQQQQLQQQQQYQEEEQEKQQAASEREETAQANPQIQYSTGLFEHIPRYPTKYPANKVKQGYIKYREQSSSAASDNPRYGSVPGKPIPEEQQQQQEQQQLDDGMPRAIYQLLNLQAQTPYHVIANQITYKPKSIFVPKPIADESTGPYKYRSKIYYLKNGEEEPESAEGGEKEAQREVRSEGQREAEEEE